MVSMLPRAPIGAVLDERLQHDAEELRERARELLSRPPYSEGEPGLLERGLRWVQDAIARLLQVLVDGIASTGALGAWLIALVGALVLVIVMWRLTRGATLDRSTPEVPSSPSARSARSWRDEARAHEQAGRRYDAVRCWYAALAVGLVEDGTLDEVPGRTVRELNVEISRVAPRLERPVHAAGDRFEAVVYGGEAAADSDVATVRDAAEQVQGSLR